MDTCDVIRIYSSDFVVTTDGYNDETGRLLLTINGTQYRALGLPVKDLQYFKHLLSKNKGKAIAFLRKNFIVERVPPQSTERPSDEAFNNFIKFMEGLTNT